MLNYQVIANDHTQWCDIVVSGVVALAGLVLLSTALIPGRAMVLPLGGPTQTVAQVRLTLRANTIRLVDADRVNDTGIADAVSAAVAARIDQVAPAIRPVIRVRVHPARKADA